jgi:glycosyltransferase involved in cell wall biosynthesis
MTALALNGRFLAQEVTGVQRFGREIARALAAMGPLAVLAPPDARDEPGLAVRRVGRRHGQAWEQLDLPRHLGGAVLVNPGNTAPLALRRQVVVIHDAAAFEVPGSYGWRFRTWYRVLHRALAWRGVRIATVSEHARAAIAGHLRLDPAALAVVGEGAEHILRAPADAALPERLGLVRPYVLAVGSLAPHKNLAALGATAAMLAGRGAELVVTGGLDARVFAAAGLPQPARLVGRVDDAGLRALYEGAACLVFPSRHEGFGLPALEAMACGCPVVAARAGALAEVCGDAALLADPLDQAGIAAAVARVLDDPALAARLRQAGRARAAGFTWQAAARRLAAVADAAGRDRKPA